MVVRGLGLGWAPRAVWVCSVTRVRLSCQLSVPRLVHSIRVRDVFRTKLTSQWIEELTNLTSFEHAGMRPTGDRR